MTLRSDHAGRTHRLNGTSHCTCIYSPPPLELVCQLCSLPERRENRLPFLKKRTVLSHKHGGAIHQPYTRTQERRRVRGMSRTERETYFTLGVSCFSLHSLVNFIFVTFFYSGVELLLFLIVVWSSGLLSLSGLLNCPDSCCHVCSKFPFDNKADLSHNNQK